ncbi:hypothetical protein [Baileyella intestinalis]|uniref:hypothetical protein n=1 Tax=Baileyella intestinalis TaxID=2606709 RepID=UPI003A8ACDD0
MLLYYAAPLYYLCFFTFYENVLPDVRIISLSYLNKKDYENSSAYQCRSVKNNCSVVTSLNNAAYFLYNSRLVAVITIVR